MSTDLIRELRKRADNLERAGLGSAGILAECANVIERQSADLAAANTVIARMREALLAANTLLRYCGVPETSPTVRQLSDALTVTPATVRDEVAELEKFIESCEREVAEVYCDITMGKFSKMNTRATAVLDCVRELEEERETALRTRAEKAEADVARLDRLEELIRRHTTKGIGMEASRTTNDVEIYRCGSVTFLGRGTLRAAIDDAARQPTPQPHEEGKR